MDKIMRLLISLLSGALFGTGLIVSDMIDPSRVLAFLDIASGQWDPTLAFVMAGAITPMLLAWRYAATRRKPVFGETFPAPATGGLNTKLFAGAASFGAGWGLVGLCPGPALTALSIGGWPVALFIGAMIAGFFLASRAARWF